MSGKQYLRALKFFPKPHLFQIKGAFCLPCMAGKQKARVEYDPRLFFLISATWPVLTVFYFV